MANYSIAQQTSFWLKSKGLTLIDLTHHEQIDDVILLANIKDEFHNEFNQSQEDYLTSLWHYVYHSKYKLKKYHYIKLKKTIKLLKSQRLTEQQLKAKQHKQAILRGKIQRIRMKGSENPATQ